MGEQDLSGICEDCQRPFVSSAAELRHRRRGRGDAPRLCSRCLIAAAHERRRPARVPVAAWPKAAPR
jgi:hypothetical protein